MVFWEVLIVGNYILALIGFVANILYFKLVVFNVSFDVYSRIASFIIASATTLLITSNVLTTSICLSYGSYFSSGSCMENRLFQIMTLLHSYGEITIVSERYASVFFPTFRLSETYKLWFSLIIIIYLISLSSYLYMMNIVKSVFALLYCTIFASVLYLVSFILVMYLFCVAKKRYYETLGIISLTKRYMLSESYELCRSSLPATISSLAINIVVFISFWCLLFDVIPQTKGQEFFVLANMTLNLTATLFPILFIIGSRKIRRRFAKINPFNQQQEIKEEQQMGVRKLDGHRISFNQSQNEYFEQLQSSWA
ncbi:Protein CBG23161 [Caenorhabditis briggsae]|uniref:Protein CBG23161 n=2 Tax=Caenorhabditis briggsae TaxID=6238 RepID=A8Y4K1_CAEBR|nr:Protein CBG23161 [Caenorhabditis briggsae]CAP39821.1 Protein CBG23161 [Caenorhabditis briggsae]